MPHISDILTHPAFTFVSAIVAAWLISIRIYPVIIYVAQRKNLMDEPEERSSHGAKTPTLGGVGMFLAFTMVLLIFGVFAGLEQTDLIKIISIAAATVILLFLGIKDDLIVLSPRKKFMGQILAAGIAIVATDVRIVGFGTLLGLGELPYLISVAFTLFVFLTIINAFNLIDGIDGLGGSVAGLASLFFGVYFLINGQEMLAVLSLALVGAIVGFLGYNFSEKEKLFMGDSGSLFLGYMLAYQGVSFLMVNAAQATPFAMPNATVLLLAVLSFPLMDCLRVFTIRIFSGKSPFKADRNHIHHRYIRLGFTHIQATGTICAANLLLVGLIVSLGSLELNIQLIIGFAAASCLYLYPFLLRGNPLAGNRSRPIVATAPVAFDQEEIGRSVGNQDPESRATKETIGRTVAERNAELPVAKPKGKVRDMAGE